MVNPAKEEIDAFISGMEHAAKMVSDTRRGAQEALKIRSEKTTLQLLWEEK